MEQNFVKISGADGPQLDTDALRAASHAFLDKGTSVAQPASTSVEQPSPAPVRVNAEPLSPLQQNPVTVTDAPQAKPDAPAADGTPAKSEINLLELPDDQLVRMKVNGEPVTMTAKDAREQMMRGAKFTREMQQLRAREEQFAQRLSDAEKLETVISDDAILAEYITKAKPHLVSQLAERMGITRAQAATAIAQEVQTQQAQPAAPAFNAEEIANLGDVSSLFDQRAQTLEQKVLSAVREQLGGVNTTVEQLVRARVQEGVKAEIAELQRANEVAAFDGKIKTTVSGILDANPALKAIPRIEQVLRFEVFQLKPKSPEEMLEAFHTAASGIVEQLDETYKTTRKTQVIDKATMEKTGIEPPVGSAPGNGMNRPISYAGQDGKVDWNLIRAAAKASIR